MNEQIYQMVTDRIIAQLQKGVIPWRKDWRDAAISYTTRKGYRGINALLLDRPGEYITFNQAKELGGSVKRGAKGYPVVFWKLCAVTDHDTGDEKMIPFPCRYYTVFHLSDVDGVPSKVRPSEALQIDADGTKAQAMIDTYADREALPIVHREQNRAYYTPADDVVTMPTREQFNTLSGYYGALLHELVHSTGHSKRLDRPGVKTTAAAFGSATYGKEELVAEIGAAMLYSLAGMGAQPQIENSAAYVQSWLSAIKEDARLIMGAASAAQRAADYVLGAEPEPTDA
jgi:antirestriction protein ArdC